MLRNLQVDWGKIPDGLDAACHQHVAYCLGIVCGNGNDADAYVIVPAEGFQPFHGIDGLSHSGLFSGRAYVKACHQIQPGILESAVIQQSLPQFTGTYQNGSGFHGAIQISLDIPDQLQTGTSGPPAACVGHLSQFYAPAHLQDSDPVP